MSLGIPSPILARAPLPCAGDAGCGEAESALAKLLALFFTLDQEAEPQASQCLTVFFPTYAASSAQHHAQLAAATVPAMRLCAGAKLLPRLGQYLQMLMHQPQLSSTVTAAAAAELARAELAASLLTEVQVRKMERGFCRTSLTIPGPNIRFCVCACDEGACLSVVACVALLLFVSDCAREGCRVWNGNVKFAGVMVALSWCTLVQYICALGVYLRGGSGGGPLVVGCAQLQIDCALFGYLSEGVHSVLSPDTWTQQKQSCQGTQ